MKLPISELNIDPQTKVLARITKVVVTSSSSHQSATQDLVCVRSGTGPGGWRVDRSFPQHCFGSHTTVNCYPCGAVFNGGYSRIFPIRSVLLTEGVELVRIGCTILNPT